MLCQSDGARSVAPRQGVRRVGAFKLLTAVGLLTLGGVAAVAPAEAADIFDGNVDSSRSRDEFGYMGPVVYNWSGVYVGGHFGGAWGEIDWSGPMVEGGTVNHEMDGYVAGGHLGFNQQFGRWVGGAEVSLSGGDVEDGGDSGVTRSEIDALFLATVRLGIAWDRALAYVKGGYASADVKLREFNLAEVALTSSERQAGFTIGGGVELALTSRVIFGLEYNRVDLGSATHVAFNDNYVDAVPVRVEPDVLHVAMARLSLKFGDEGAPMVAPAVLK